MSKNILCVGDVHARPGVNNNRGTILGRFIKDKQPDIVWMAGDVGDFASLSSYDKGTYHAEGQRYAHDLVAVADFLDKVQVEIKGMAKRPRLVVTLGNHEDRISRAAFQTPELYGSISTKDIPFEYYGWEVVPFLQPLVMQGIVFQHYFTSGNYGRPIDNERRVLTTQHVSCVYGHNHLKQWYCLLNGMKKRIFALGVGCFDIGKHHYTREEQRWWRGLCMLYEAKNGWAEHAWWGMDYLKRKYL